MSDENKTKLDCAMRSKAALRDVVTDLEKHFGSEETLIVAAGAMRSLALIERMAQRIAREDAGGSL